MAFKTIKASNANTIQSNTITRVVSMLLSGIVFITTSLSSQEVEVFKNDNASPILT
jgi:hypothetical protein